MMLSYRFRPSHLKTLLFSLLVLLLSGCSESDTHWALGTLERDRIVLRATASEIVTDTFATEGTKVKNGEKILQLDSGKQQAIVTAAIAEVERAYALLDEKTNGARPEEIAAAKSEFLSQRALYKEADKNHQRIVTLVGKNILTKADLDTALAKKKSLHANLQKARNQLLLLTNGTRPEALEQVEASLAKAKASLELEQRKLEDLSVLATRDSWLDSFTIKQGERVTQGSPVATLLADEAPWARVYIPESLRTKIHIGDWFSVYINDFEKVFQGQVRKIALDPAFTPFFALNEKERSRLVYMAEIQLPETASELPSGIPVQVELQP